MNNKIKIDEAINSSKSSEQYNDCQLLTSAVSLNYLLRKMLSRLYRRLFREVLRVIFHISYNELGMNLRRYFCGVLGVILQGEV